MTKRKIPARQADILARKIRDELAVGCEEIEVAGSLRRRAPFVGDLELVARPRWRPALFGDGKDFDELHEAVSRLVALGSLSWREVSTGKVIRPPKTAENAGRKYYPLIATRSGVPLDLFVVRPPATWGVIFAIRTGDRDFSRCLVQRAAKLGHGVTEGALRAERGMGAAFDTSTERAFFEAIRAPWVPPEERSATTGLELLRGVP